MKTMSNAELQECIAKTAAMHREASKDAQTLILLHLQDLLNEQYLRAIDSHSLAIEPMEPAQGRVDFDARVRAQDHIPFGEPLL